MSGLDKKFFFLYYTSERQISRTFYDSFEVRIVATLFYLNQLDSISSLQDGNPSSRLKKIGASQKHHHGRPTSAPVVTPPTANRLDTSLSEPWSESFTVQLGRQMRTTCNFRLLRADPNDLLLSISPTNPSEKCCADGAAPDGTK